MARNWNDIWRWAHILFSLPVIVYFAAISNFDYEWSEDVHSMVADYFIWLLMWTGIAKWQLPTLPPDLVLAAWRGPGVV